MGNFHLLQPDSDGCINSLEEALECITKLMKLGYEIHIKEAVIKDVSALEYCGNTKQ